MRHALVVVALAIGLAVGTASPASRAEDPAARAPVDEQPAPPAASASRMKLLVLDVKGADLDDSQRDALAAVIAARASRFAALEVLAAADLRELAELEANKQAAGCDESSASCLAELAGAMGAELVLTTRAGKLDAVYVVSLQLFDARKASAVGRATLQAWSLPELPEKLGPAVDELLSDATGTAPVQAAPVATTRPQQPLAADDAVRLGLQVGGGVMAGLGLVAAVLGAVPAWSYGQKKDELANLTAAFTGTAAEIEDAQRLREQALEAKDTYNDVGRWALAGGASLVVIGAGALAAGFLLPSSSTAAPTEGGP